MTMENRGARAAHLEELASRMTEIDTRPIDGHLLGMQEQVAEALDHPGAEERDPEGLLLFHPRHEREARGHAKI